MASIVPKVRRDLDFLPVEHQGQRLVLVRDHLGLVPQGKALALPIFKLLSMLDGGADKRDLQAMLMRQQGGVLVGMSEVEGLLKGLDQAFLLESESFHQARQGLVDRFAAQAVRPAALAGSSYPTAEDELRDWLTEILTQGPQPAGRPGRLLALAAPHIDPAVGKAVYASAYGCLGQDAPGRVILLGTGHRLSTAWFSLCNKAFATPLGEVPCDREAAASLSAAGSGVLAPDDFDHRAEHSLEFQLLFLQYLLPPGSFEIVPILCGSAAGPDGALDRQAYRVQAAGFLAALRRLAADPRRTTLVVAGVDLSHIGPKFGHQQSARALQAPARAHDQALLQHLCARQADAFWQELAQAEDGYNVCGFSSLACLLEILPPSKGETLAYDMNFEEPTNSAVSYAAVGFWG